MEEGTPEQGPQVCLCMSAIVLTLKKIKALSHLILHVYYDDLRPKTYLKQGSIISHTQNAICLPHMNTRALYVQLHNSDIKL